jgi:predicted double-glycine peptidase
VIRRALAAAILLITATPGTARPLSLLDVPFIAQSEALCGGAAAAMVLRYWGERKATADDFASLVNRNLHGITTTALVAAVRNRGWTAQEIVGANPLQREVTLGRPVIVLLEDRPRRFHYVVVVGWHDRAIVLHDPARAPFRVMGQPEFKRRWRTGRRWALVVLPPSGAQVPSPTVTIPLSSAPRAGEPAGAREDCNGLVAEGIQLARSQDLSGAERALADAVFRCGGAAPLRELAGVRLLQHRWPEVGELASEALRLAPGDEYAIRLLAASRFAEQNFLGALRAWNQIGEPRVDHVSIDGLERTRYRVVETFLGIPHDVVLTPDLLDRSRRRLEELPSARGTSIEYEPTGNGHTDVRVRMAEWPLFPRRPLDYLSMAARTATQREIAAQFTGPSGGGEVLTASWRFWPERPRYALTLAVPAAVGLTTATAYVERQPFTSADVPESSRRGGNISVGRWMTSTIHLDARLGGDRWEGRGTFATTGGAVRWRSREAEFEMGATAWLGETAFVSSHGRVQWHSSPEPRGVVFLAVAAFAGVSAQTPMDLWPAGDVGQCRDVLLRAHPLLDAGRVQVDRVGRTYVGGSVAVQRWMPAAPLVRVGMEVFADGGDTRQRIDSTHVADLDVGVGARIALPGTAGVFRVDAAYGARDGHRAVSVLWSPDWAAP